MGLTEANFRIVAARAVKEGSVHSRILPMDAVCVHRAKQTSGGIESVKHMVFVKQQVVDGFLHGLLGGCTRLFFEVNFRLSRQLGEKRKGFRFAIVGVDSTLCRHTVDHRIVHCTADHDSLLQAVQLKLLGERVIVKFRPLRLSGGTHQQAKQRYKDHKAFHQLSHISLLQLVSKVIICSVSARVFRNMSRVTLPLTYRLHSCSMSLELFMADR